MNIVEATRSYERWLNRHTPLIPSQLRLKHAAMREGVFPFLRATFYRWAQIWPQVCPELAAGPRVLGAGDLHVENFGTWRDAEGRLVWGINDFDEAAPIAYTNDLVRLVASSLLAGREAVLGLSQTAVAEAVLEGYRDGWQQGGQPFLLGERNKRLLRMAEGELRAPALFWQKMDGLKSAQKVPKSAQRAIQLLLPVRGLPLTFVHRICGLGSLGRQRYVGLTEWQGGHIAREAKATAPSAWVWAGQAEPALDVQYQRVLDTAVRCVDPFVRWQDGWLVRRLSPDCCRIELADLPVRRDERRLLYCMGWETANVHLGSSKAAKRVGAHLGKRPGWLLKASRAMMQASGERLEAVAASQRRLGDSGVPDCRHAQCRLLPGVRVTIAQKGFQQRIEDGRQRFGIARYQLANALAIDHQFSDGLVGVLVGNELSA